MRNRGLVFACLLVWVTASAQAAQEHVRATASVDLRNCPDLGSSACSIAKTLPPQTEMELIGRHLDWFQVRVLPAGDTGWVHSKYVTVPFGGTGEMERRRRVHDRTSMLLIPVGIVGLIYFFIALTRSRGGARQPLFSRLLFDPRIAVSWVFFCEVGLLGILLVTSNLNSNLADLSLKDYALTATFSGYAGWALYWGTPACWRLWRRCLSWFGSFSLIGLLGALLSLILAFWLGCLYSFWGGGVFHFGKRWIAG